MTIDEATVCMNKALPVVTTCDIYDRMNEQEFTITAVNRCFQGWSKKSIYTAQLTRNKKHYYSVDIDSVQIAEKYKNVLDDFVRQMKRAKLKTCINELVEQGGNKTSITKFVRELIDEIKKE